MAELADKFRGTLVGLAVGDALGAPLEFMSAAEIRRQHGTVRDMLGGGWLRLQPGRYTDDTEMALCIAESLDELGQFNAEDIAQRFVAWADSDPKDIGVSTRAAIRYLREGVPVFEAARRAWEDSGRTSAGNGSVMRCAPVALFDCFNPQALVADSIASSKITHWDERCFDGCALVNHLISLLVRDETSDLLADARQFLAGRSPHLREATEKLRTLSHADLRPTGYVVDTVQAALWCLTHSESLEDALVTCVNLGGDADTTGAVCGALAGAQYGMDAIPTRWLDALHGKQHLIGLASALYRLAHRSSL